MGRRATRTQKLPFTKDHVTAISEALDEPQWMLDQRLAAWELAEEMPMPTTSDEPWRRTDISRLRWGEMIDYREPGDETLDDVPAELYKPLIGEEQGGLIVFVNGKVVHTELADEIAEQGVIFTDLSTAAAEHPDLMQEYFLTQAVTTDEGKFAALHAALWTHGVFLYVPSGVHVELPFHSVEYAPGHRTTGTHILAVVEENASASYLHESTSPELDQRLVHLHATELLTGDAANLRYVALQNWSQNVYNFGHQRGRVGRGSQLDWVDGQIGTRLSKVFMDIDLDGDDSWGRISGLFFTDKKQHLDIDTQQNHHAVRTVSDLLYKGALKGDSRMVWQGMIKVDQVAQQTDGFQANRNLILEPSARSDSIPGLEIRADDVRCTHAATAGKIDEREIFYLMSRGIPRHIAEKMIVHGFFDPVLDRIPFEEVRERLNEQIEAKLEQ